MKENIKRVATGSILMLILIAVFIINNPIIDSIVVVLISLIGMNEYNNCFKAKGHNPIPAVGYLSCLGILLIGADIDILTKIRIVAIFIPVILIIMFMYIIIKKLEVTIIDVAITILSIIYVPFLFSFIKLLFILPNGRIFVALACTASIATDTFAYEIGSRLGKHKLSPIVSPKKSIEGSIAGILGSVLFCCILGIITNTYFNTSFNILVLAIIAIILSIVGQIGDLAASAIKRYCGQKDFSNLLPGHGGILDRFDSIMFILPVVYAFIYLFNLV